MESSTSPFGLGSGGWLFLVGSLLVILVAALVHFLVKRQGVDQQYARIAPGRNRSSLDKATIIRAKVANVPAVDTPPQEMPVRLVCAAADQSKSSGSAATATVIGMAVRGYLTIQLVGGDLMLSRTDGDPVGLDQSERVLHDGLFRVGPVVYEARLAKRPFGRILDQWLAAVDQEIAGKNWWKTHKVGNWLFVVGILLAIFFLLATIAMIFLAFDSQGDDRMNGFGWPCLAGLVVSGILCSMSWTDEAHPRTPDGSVVAIQAIGFKTYLETVQAHQMRLATGRDIFSEYLPYAIAFGCHERWAGLFAELAAKGAVLPRPTWYVTDSDTLPIWTQISKLVENLTDDFGTAVFRFVGWRLEDFVEIE